MKVRMRYDDRGGAFTPVAPRVELVYRPEQSRERERDFR